jgi:hypothetical protein
MKAEIIGVDQGKKTKVQVKVQVRLFPAKISMKVRKSVLNST